MVCDELEYLGFRIIYFIIYIVGELEFLELGYLDWVWIVVRERVIYSC